MGWWSDLNLLLKLLYVISASSTLILLIQTILAIFGVGDDGHDMSGGEAGADSDVYLDASADTHIDAQDGVYNGEGVHDTGGTSPLDLTGLRIFTIRGVTSFFAIGGWTSIVLIQANVALWLSMLIGLTAGLLTMILIAKIMQMTMRLQSNGNIDVRNAIGKSGTVYLVIPPKGEGRGKVNVVVQERLTEFDAVTYEEYALPTGCNIRITDVIASDVLVVESLD